MNLDTKQTYLLLGSNLGDREEYLERAIQLIAASVGDIISRSATYKTAAWGKVDQPGFLNLAVGVTTSLKPLELLQSVLAIEQNLGRARHEKWGARKIDIDIILYGDEVVNIRNKLQIPHPEMQNRKFVMVPLTEIAPYQVHPVLGQTMTELLLALSDPLTVEKKEG